MSIDVDEIRERCERATIGPWDVREFAHEATPWSERRVYRVEISSPVLDANGNRVGGRPVCQIIDYAEWTTSPANAAFIAHARTDIPALCDALAASEKRVRELEEALKAIMHTYDDGGVPLTEAFQMANRSLKPEDGT
jgi:hypothetical protein